MGDDEAVYDTLVAAFIDDYHRVGEETLRAVARSIAAGQVDLRTGVERLAEMLEVPPPQDFYERVSPSAMARGRQQESHSHASIAKLRGARRNNSSESPLPRTDAAAAAAARNRTREHRATVGPGISGVAIDDLCDRGIAHTEHMMIRHLQVQELRRAWNKGLGEALRVARSQLDAKKSAGERHLAVVAWVGELGTQQRMKERVDLTHLAALLGVISAALGDLANARGPVADAGLLACIDAARAMHSRFDGRTSALIASGGSVDAVNAAVEAREQFQVLRTQLEHHGQSRHDEVGDHARQFCGMVR